MTFPEQENPLALYIHWPFCVSKCPYCDFNSHVRETVDQVAWRESLLADLKHEWGLLPDRNLGSIFFGGGTPSLMPPETVSALIDAATRFWPPKEGLEVTLEGNPSTVEAARFADLASAGVNRVSLGLQSLDESALQFLGRAHGVDEGLGALEVAQKHFDRVSFDLIYARPGQTLAAWEAELTRALSFGTEHLSLYQLTIEPGTRFATLAAKGDLIIPDADAAADLWDVTQELTRTAGLPLYEVSNHARPGCESRHNMAYWRYTDYVGIGPGAHGRRTGQATLRHKKPENWMAAVERNGHGLQEETTLTTTERATEALVMGLRLAEGVDLSRIGDAYVDFAAVERLAGHGLIVREGDRLRVTAEGIPVLEGILREVVRD